MIGVRGVPLPPRLSRTAFLLAEPSGRSIG
jgi:hypothetical protein